MSKFSTFHIAHGYTRFSGGDGRADRLSYPELLMTFKKKKLPEQMLNEFGRIGGEDFGK
jgi:hypothetical protein